MEMENETGSIRPCLLITLIVAIIAGAVFFTWYSWNQKNTVPTPVASGIITPTKSVTPTPTATSLVSTADWKTYTNTTYNFSIKYPKDWALTEKPATDINKDIVLLGKFKVSNTSTKSAGDIGITFSISDKTATALRDAQQSGAGNMVANSTEKEVIFTSGAKALVSFWDYTNTDDGGPFRIHAYYIDGSPTISIVATSPVIGSDDILKTADQVISTFQFTK